jgi:hypothetical protein
MQAVLESIQDITQSFGIRPQIPEDIVIPHSVLSQPPMTPQSATEPSRKRRMKYPEHYNIEPFYI